MERLRLPRGRLTDQDEADACLLELLMGAMQLHRVVAAVHSPVVAQPDERDGTLPPQVAEANAVAVLIREDDVGELLRVLHVRDTTRMEWRRVEAGVPPASELVEAMVAEMEPLYGRIDVEGAPTATADDFSPERGGAFVVGFDDDGSALAGGGLKRLEPGVVEIKRMYVVPAARGRRLGRELLVALEDAARDLGYTVARLDTGEHQPHAEAMYREAGYEPIGNFNANPFASFWGEKRL